MDTTFRQRALGEESFELRELNERLESYLQRVAFLEQENSFLRGEIQALKVTPACGKRGEFEQGLEGLREALAERWRETDRASLERDGLREEIRLMKVRCAGEASRREEAWRQLGESRRELEDEKRGQEGLGHKVLMLQDELKFLEETHQEERASLQEERSRSSPGLAPFSAASPSLCTQEVDLYSQKVGQLWKASLEVYQKELGAMERSLAEARERLEAVKEEKRQNRVQLQSAQQEVEVLRERKGLLEGRVSQQSQMQREAFEQFQATIGLLEQDKESLAAKMDQILDEQHQLMQMKLALSLEVATYRALLDAEIRRTRPPSVTPRLPASHRDARVRPDRNELAFQGRRAIPVEKPLYTSKSRDGDGDIASLRAQLHSGTDFSAYGLRARSLARVNRPNEFQLPTIDTASSESKATARRVKSQEATPALGSEKNPSCRSVLEHAALPQREPQRVDRQGHEVGKAGFVTAKDQLDGESEESVTEGKNEVSNGEPRREQGQLDGGVKEDVIGGEEFEWNKDRVSDAMLANGTSKEHVDGEQPEVAEDKEGLIQEDAEINEETRECLTGEQLQEPEMEFDLESGKLLFNREHPAEDAVEIIVRENDLRLKKQQVNGDAKERGVEGALSEGTANPGAGKSMPNGTSSENVTGGDAPQINPEMANKQEQSAGETKENVRDNRPGISEEENDFGSPKALYNGTTEEHMADELKPQVPQEDLGSGKGQLNGGPKEHAVGVKESEMLEETIDSVSSGRTQNYQTEVEEPGAPEGSNNLEPVKELWSDTDEEHSTVEMSQVLERKKELEPEEPLGRDTEEHAVGEDTAEITEENLTPENGEANELATDEESELAEVNFDSTSEKGLLADANREQVLEESGPGRLGDLTGKKIPASENLPSAGGLVTGDADDEVTEVQKDQVVEQQEYSRGMKERVIEEELDVSEGAMDPESEKLLSSDNIQKHALGEETQISEETGHLVPEDGQVSGAVKEHGSDEETPISEGTGHLVPENGQASGAGEEHGSDEETSEGKIKAESEKVLLVNATEGHAEEDKPAAILGKEDLGSEERELNEETKEHAAENGEPEISEVAEQEVPHTEEETFEGMEGLGSGMGMFGDTVQEHVTDQEIPQTEEVERKITEDDGLGAEERQSNGEAKGRWIEEKQPEISEELADQTVEEGLPSDTQAMEDTKFQKTEEKIDLGSEKDQPKEEAKDRAADEEDSEVPEGVKDISERELLSDTAKERATEEITPTSEGRNDLVPVKEDLEHEANKDPSVGKVAAEEFTFSDRTHEQERPQVEEEMFGTPEEEDNLEPEVGETKEHVTAKEQSEIAEDMTGQVPEAEPSSDTSQELATGEMPQESEGEEDIVSKKGQRVEETQMRATEGEKCQSSELKVEVVSDTGLRSGAAKEDMVEDDLEATGRKQDLMRERVLFNDTTKEFVTEEDKKPETTEDKEDPESEKGQFNEDIKEHVAETESSEGQVDPVSEKALLSEVTVRPTTEEDKTQLTEGRKELGSEEGHLSEETEEHIEEDKKPEIAERKVAATGDDEDYLEMKIASSVEEMDPVKDEDTFCMEETHGEMEKRVEPVLDELSESEERQEAEEERAASPFVTENKERQPQEEEPLTSSAVQSLKEDCLAEVLQTQSLPESEELSKAPDGVDGTAEEDQEYSLQSAQEVLLEAQSIGGQSLGECPADVSQSLSEAGTTSEGVSQGEDTAPWEDTFSESSVNADDVTVEKRQTWTVKEGMAGDINDDKSDLTTMLNFGGEQDGADLVEKSEVTSISNGEGSSTRNAVIESEDDGSINVREPEDETVTKMVDKSQTPVTVDAFEDVNMEPPCVKADRRSTPSDVDSSLTSDDEDSPNASQTLENSANAAAGHGQNLEPLLPENQPQESSNGVKTAEQEDPRAVEEVVESREFLRTFKEEKSRFAIPKLGGDPDRSPEGEMSVRKDQRMIKMDDVCDSECLMDEPVATAFQEETMPEVVLSTSPEKIEDSQSELHGPREETEGNSLNVSQLGSLNRNSPELTSDPAMPTAAMTGYNNEKTESEVPGEPGKLFGEDGLHESSASQELQEELGDENGETKIIEDTYDSEYETAAFSAIQHSPEDIGDEQSKKDASQRVSRELEQEVHCDSVDLPLSTESALPPQGTGTDDDKGPHSIISWPPKDQPQELNELQGDYFGGSGKGEKTAVETIAAAYQYWSSEDD